MTYDSTGMYTNVYTDVNGCDSTVTLILQLITVHHTLQSLHVIPLIGMA